MRKPADVLKLVKDNDIKIIDLRFMDMPGLWQHFSVPTHELTESSFEEGFGFDGSSIRGFQAIHESDMLVVPDPDTAFVDAFTEVPTLNLICNVVDPVTKERYGRDPRGIAQRAESYLQYTKIADTAYFGPEAEFFIFDDVRFDQNAHSGYYFLDSVEGQWNTGKDEKPNLGYRPRHKEGYFPVPPHDHFQDLRTEMVLNLERAGMQVEAHHHEVATGGQMEIDVRFDSLTRAADHVIMYKYIVKNTATKRGRTVTFMPKPLLGTTARACTATRACGRAGRTCSRATATADSRRWACTISAGS